MRDRMERFVLLPFSIGCVSESSIAVAVHHDHQHRFRRRRSSKSPDNSHNNISSPIIRDREEDDEESLSSESMKNSYRFMAASKPDISTGFNRFFKGFKNFSQLFVYNGEDMEEDEEEEIEIGFPTDVKHVTHIGIDGNDYNNNNTNIIDPINGWDHLISSVHHHHHLFSDVSLEQFKLSSMAAEAHHEAQPPLVNDLD